MTWQGTGVPALGARRPTAPTASLFPDPVERMHAIRTLHHLVPPPKAVRFEVEVGDAIACANEVTAAIRATLPTPDRHDSAALWDAWRRIVLRLREEVRGDARDREPTISGWGLAFGLDRITDALVEVQARPGDFARGYCPWRADFFTLPRLHPEDFDDDEPDVRNAAPAAPPPIVEVRILDSENEAVPRASFRSLWDADAALAKAFAIEPPPGNDDPTAGYAYDKTMFLVRWADGLEHQGRADVTRLTLVAARARGGILRRQLEDYFRWYASDAYPRAYGQAHPAEHIEATQARAREILRRLYADTASHIGPRHARNARPARRRGTSP